LKKALASSGIMPGMRHGILGAGGIGGLMGTCLAHVGEKVTMVVRQGTAATFPEQLHLQSTLGTFEERVDKSETSPSVDVLWVTVKATQLEDSLVSVPKGQSTGIVVPLLNGIDHLALLSGRFGENKVIPATIAVESERVAPGRYVHPSPFVRLNIAERGRQWLEPVVGKLTEMGFTSRWFDNDATLMWSKMAVLAPLALATSAADTSVEGLVDDPRLREQVEGCVREIAAVAAVEGGKVEADTIIASILRLPRTMRSSMQKDLEQGNAPELDAIAGPVLRAAKKHGIPVTVTQALTEAVERRAKGILASH
jgi:2-dehydropantoate 2-reductase